MKRKSRKRSVTKPHLKFTVAVPAESLKSILETRKIPVNPVNGFIAKRSWDLNTVKIAYSLDQIKNTVELHGSLETVRPEVTEVSLTLKLTTFAKWMIGWGAVCVAIAVIASSSILVFIAGIPILIFASLLVDFLVLLWLAFQLRSLV